MCADLDIRPAQFWLPMAGVTETLFGVLIRGLGGAGLLMTEFTSSKHHGSAKEDSAPLFVFSGRRASDHPRNFGARP